MVEAGTANVKMASPVTSCNKRAEFQREGHEPLPSLRILQGLLLREDGGDLVGSA